MKALVIVLGLAVASPAAAAGKLLTFDLDVDLDIKGRQQLAMACLVAAATKAPPTHDPKKIASWCVAAAAHLYALYPPVKVELRGGK